MNCFFFGCCLYNLSMMPHLTIFWISLLYIFDVCIGIETIWRTQTWESSNPRNITCDPNDSDCIIQCSTGFACGSMENSIKPYIKCPQNDQCKSCIINCIEDSSCNNNIILSGNCKKVEINLQKANNKNMWIRAPNDGNLYINLISDESMFDNNYIYSSSNTNNIILDCSGNSCQRNVIYGELIQNSLNISCINGNNCDQQEIHCPDNNKHDLNPKCNVLCDTGSSCYDLNIFAMNGTRERNGVSFNCMSSSNCDLSRVHCRNNGICNMEQNKITNEWYCDGICSDNNLLIPTTISPIPSITTPSPTYNNINDPKFISSNTTNVDIISQEIDNQTDNDHDNDNGNILYVNDNDNNNNNNNETNEYMVLAYLLLGCVIGGCAFCIAIVCIISCIVKNRVSRKREFEQRQQEQQQHNESSLSYTPTKDANNDEIDDVEMIVKPDTNELSKQKSESLTTKTRKRKNTLTASHTFGHKRKPTTFGSMVISEMKDTFVAIAGLEVLEHSTSNLQSVNIDVPPKPKMLRHSTSDPRYGQKNDKKSRQLIDRARMKRIEQSLNEDLNISGIIAMDPNVKSASNAATRGSTTNVDTLSQDTEIAASDAVSPAKGLSSSFVLRIIKYIPYIKIYLISKDNQYNAKQPSSKPLKYNCRHPIESPTPTKDGLQRSRPNDTRALATNFHINLNPKSVNANIKHRVNQSQPILLMANQSITVSTGHAYNSSNDTLHDTEDLNNINSSSSGSEETSDTTQQSSSDNDDNSSQSSSETSDDDTEDTITTATTRTTIIADLAPLSVPSDIHSIHLPPPPIAGKSKSSPTGSSSKPGHHRSKPRHHRSRRMKKQFSIAKSPKMDDIPEEQDLEMTPSTRHNTTNTRSTTLKLQPALFSNDSKYSKYSADTEGTNIDNSETDKYAIYSHQNQHRHQQYQTMVFHDEKYSSNETSINTNISDVDIDNLHRKIQTMNRKLQETHSNNTTGSTLNDNYTTYTDTMTMSTNTSLTSDTTNTSYSSD